MWGFSLAPLPRHSPHLHEMCGGHGLSSILCLCHPGSGCISSYLLTRKVNSLRGRRGGKKALSTGKERGGRRLCPHLSLGLVAVQNKQQALDMCKPYARNLQKAVILGKRQYPKHTHTHTPQPREWGRHQ